MNLSGRFMSILGDPDLHQTMIKDIKKSFAEVFDLSIRDVAVMLDFLESQPEDRDRARLILNNLLVHKCLKRQGDPVEYINRAIDRIANGFRLDVTRSDIQDSICYSDMGELMAAIGCKRTINKDTGKISPVYECVYLLNGAENYKPLPIGIIEAGEILNEMDIRGNPYNWYTTRCMYEPKEETSGPKDPNSLYRLDIFGGEFGVKVLSQIN